MNELAYRYTEERYCTKQEIAKHLNVSMVDPVWQEVNRYRQPFIVSTGVSQPLGFCLCAGILLRLVRLRQLPRSQRKTADFFDLSCLEAELSEAARWMIRHWSQLHLDLAEMIHEAFRCNRGLHENAWRSALLDDSLPVECRWILIVSQCEARGLALTLAIALALRYDKMEELCLLDQTLFSLCAKQDGTYALQRMLDTLESGVQKTAMQEEAIPLDYTRLRYQYPQLRDYQIRFYLEHSIKGYFYTLEQFSAFAGVCYETARCAMEQLVELHFYEKLKQGKKFVYTRP